MESMFSRSTTCGTPQVNMQKERAEQPTPRVVLISDKSTNRNRATRLRDEAVKKRLKTINAEFDWRKAEVYGPCPRQQAEEKKKRAVQQEFRQIDREKIQKKFAASQRASDE